MYYSNQDESEYTRFIIETGIKIKEITEDYNKLSDKNKYRIHMLVKAMLNMNMALRIL